MVTQTCPKCKKNINSSAKFCNFCGTKVVIVETPVSAPEDLSSFDKYRYRPAIETLVTHPEFEKGFSTLKKKIPDIVEKVIDTQPNVSSEFLAKLWGDLPQDNPWLVIKYIDWAKKLKSKLPADILSLLEQRTDPLIQTHLKQYVVQN